MARFKKSARRAPAKKSKARSMGAGSAAKKSVGVKSSGRRSGQSKQDSAKASPFLAANNNSRKMDPLTAAGNPWGAFADPNAMKRSADMMKGFWSQANGAQKAFSVGKSANAASRSLNEVVKLGQEGIEACVECGSIAADLGRELSDELMSFTNNVIAQNVELSKDAMSCRTINDLFDLQSKLLRSNLDEFMSESAHLSELFFEMASRIAEPISDHVSCATERLSKTIAA